MVGGVGKEAPLLVGGVIVFDIAWVENDLMLSCSGILQVIIAIVLAKFAVLVIFKATFEFPLIHLLLDSQVTSQNRVC